MRNQSKSNKNSFNKLLTLVGVASAGILFSLPGFAQVAPSSPDMSNNQRERVCGGYEGNATTGGGYYCAMNRLFPNRGAQYQTPPAGSSYSNQGRSTTGAGYPGNGVIPQGRDNSDNSMNQGSNNSGSNTQSETTPQGSYNNGGSTTGAGYPGNGVIPQSRSNSMNR